MEGDKQKPAQEPKKDKSDIITAHIEFNMKTNSLNVQSSCPTVLLYGILMGAIATAIERQVEKGQARRAILAGRMP